MKRLMATRAASICFVSSQQRSNACNPYSPNATVFPREAIPERFTRCILRYFNLPGVKGRAKPPKALHTGSGDSCRSRFCLLALVLSLADPAFNSQLAVKGVGFGKAVIDISSQGMQRNA